MQSRYTGDNGDRLKLGIPRANIMPDATFASEMIPTHMARSTSVGKQARNGCRSSATDNCQTLSGRFPSPPGHVLTTGVLPNRRRSGKLVKWWIKDGR